MIDGFMILDSRWFNKFKLTLRKTWHQNLNVRSAKKYLEGMNIWRFIWEFTITCDLLSVNLAPVLSRIRQHLEGTTNFTLKTEKPILVMSATKFSKLTVQFTLTSWTIQMSANSAVHSVHSVHSRQSVDWRIMNTYLLEIMPLNVIYVERSLRVSNIWTLTRDGIITWPAKSAPFAPKHSRIKLIWPNT